MRSTVHAVMLAFPLTRGFAAALLGVCYLYHARRQGADGQLRRRAVMLPPAAYEPHRVFTLVAPLLRLCRILT